MNWKNNFNEKVLKQGLKSKDKISDVSYDGYTFKASVKSKKNFEVEIVLQDNTLFDMSCTCSKKSSCTHEAAVLYFIEEFPEVLEDFDNGNVEKITDVYIDYDIKIISESKLRKFIKQEFRKNPKLKYDFIKQFRQESLIDEKAYEKKLKSIFRRGKGNGFSYHGYYSLNRIGSDLKKFIKKDIALLIEQEEYKFAAKLLNEIMDKLIDQIYWNEDLWYDIGYYYRYYARLIIRKKAVSKTEIEHMRDHIRIINDIIF